MAESKVFTKYQTKGANYHYREINWRNPKHFNAYVAARYFKNIQLIKHYLSNTNFDSSKPIKILDMGCGDGVLLFLLKKHLPNIKFQLHGIDLSDEALGEARKKMQGAIFLKTDVYNTTLKNDFFDIVVSSDVIEHVDFPKKMLAEAQRVAKNNALLIFSTPIRYTEYPLDSRHVKEFFPNEFQSLFSGFFSLIKLHQSHPLAYWIKYRKVFSLFGIKMGINRYWFNFLSFLDKNPFLRENNKELQSYMFAVGTKSETKE